jgi:hypothetical protein
MGVNDSTGIGTFVKFMEITSENSLSVLVPSQSWYSASLSSTNCADLYCIPSCLLPSLALWFVILDKVDVRVRGDQRLRRHPEECLHDARRQKCIDDALDDRLKNNSSVEFFWAKIRLMG